MIYAVSLLVALAVTGSAFSPASRIGRYSIQTNSISTLLNKQTYLKSSKEDKDGSNARIKQIVEDLSSGTKSGSEVELEFKNVESIVRQLEYYSAIGGSLVGLVLSSFLNGVIPEEQGGSWVGPLGLAIGGGAAYYGSIQKQRMDISELLLSVLGKPVYKASKLALEYVDSSVEEAKAKAVKKVEATIEDINRVPITIRDSIIDAKDSVVTKAKAIPVNFQAAVGKSYDEAKVKAIQNIDIKISEVSRDTKPTLIMSNVSVFINVIAIDCYYY
jgi:hypothetical protein